MRSKKSQEKEIGKINRSNQYKSDSITVFYGQLVLSNSPSSTDSVRKFCPFPVEVKEDDPRRVLLKDRFKFIIYSYDNVLNSDYVERVVIKGSMIDQKINYKYLYNDVSQRLDRNIVVESNSSSFINEGRDRVVLLTSFLDVMNLQGREIFIGYISLTKSDEFRAELNQGLKEWDDSFEKFFSRVSKIRALVNEENKGLINFDKKFTLVLWGEYTGLEVGVWPNRLLNSMRNEVKRDPCFLILKGWYSNVRKWSNLVLEKHTCSRLEFRCSLINYQWTVKYYFGYTLKELESHINTNKSSCESDDVGVFLVEEFVSESFKWFWFWVDNAIRSGKLSKAGQVKVEESIKEFKNSYDVFIYLLNKLADEANKAKKEGYLVIPPLASDFELKPSQKMVKSIKVNGVGTFYVTRRMVALDPRLLLLNDSCQYYKDMCNHLLNNVLSSWDYKGRKVVKNLEKDLISRHHEVEKWVVNYISYSYYYPKVLSFDESVVKVNNFLEGCSVAGADAIKSLSRKMLSKRRIKELQELLEEWEKFNKVFADRGSLLVSDVNVLKYYILRPFIKRLSPTELGELSFELAKEAYPFSYLV